MGEAIAGQRERWVVSTKVGLRRGPSGERITDAGPGTIRASLEGSLRHLGTDCLDLYLYHSRPDQGEISAGKEILERLKQEGKVRHYGVSTNRLKLLDRMLAERVAEVPMFS